MIDLEVAHFGLPLLSCLYFFGPLHVDGSSLQEIHKIQSRHFLFIRLAGVRLHMLGCCLHDPMSGQPMHFSLKGIFSIRLQRILHQSLEL